MTLMTISPHDLTQTATKINLEIYEFDFGKKITLKISFFDNNDVFLLYKFVVMKGQDYIDMTINESTDTFILMFVQKELGIIFEGKTPSTP